MPQLVQGYACKIYLARGLGYVQVRSPLVIQIVPGIGFSEGVVATYLGSAASPAIIGDETIAEFLPAMHAVAVSPGPR